MERRALGAMGGQRTWLLLVAVLVAVLTSWQLTVRGITERVALSLFPGGTIVPVSQIRAHGPVADAARPLIVSTSLPALKDQADQSDPSCQAGPTESPPRGLADECWWNMQTPTGMLLIATLRPFCDSYGRFGILNRTTLRIRVVDRCPDPPGGWGALARPSYTLLGVPLDRLPQAMLTVRFDDDRAGSAMTVVSL